MPQLNRLDFGDKTLLVKIDEIHFDYGYTWNNQWSQTKPMTIRGKFEVNNIHNATLDIQNCLGNPFNKRPKLEYNTKEYPIVLTGVTWGFEHPEEGFGQYLSYSCTFIATGYDHVSSGKEDTNRVIWDAGRIDISILDIQELVGEEDIDILADRALALLEKYDKYQPTSDHPCPSSVEGIGVEEDVAAVLALTKPAAVLNETELSHNPLLVLLVKEVQARGLRVETVENFGTKHTKVHSIVVGIPYNVRQIVELIRQGVEHDSVNEYYYWRLGKLLGHPDDALANFVKNVKDFGFNRA